MRRLAALLIALVGIGTMPAGARADGDPASDVLLLQNLYAPYQPALPPGLQNGLTTLLKQSAAAGYPLKVAIIATANDLGAVPNLFGRPQEYARFLGSEIAFNSKKPLLVVMPAGYGLMNAPASAAPALRGLAAPAAATPDVLGNAAIQAVLRLARAGGHPLATPRVASSGSSSSKVSPALVFGAPVVLLVIAGVLISIRQRSARARPG
ncbi:MAG: hypothetical protein NVSMB25_14100 [Thermoleophilaceae bacterium]